MRKKNCFTTHSVTEMACVTRVAPVYRLVFWCSVTTNISDKIYHNSCPCLSWSVTKFASVEIYQNSFKLVFSVFFIVCRFNTCSAIRKHLFLVLFNFLA